MHYKDGTPARLGDLVKYENTWLTGKDQVPVTTVYVGILGTAQPGNGCCDGTLLQCVTRTTVGEHGSHSGSNGTASCELGKCEKVA